MAKTKVPSQYASGKETFNDNLVGFQITDGSSQMTNTSFTIDRTIPDKDSKTFHNQPFSDFLTLETIGEEAVLGSIATAQEPNRKIKFYDSKNDGARSLFGSLRHRLSVSVQNIITKFPAALYVDATSPISLNSITADTIVYDISSNTTEFKVQNSLIYNPLDVVIVMPKSNTLPDTDNEIRNFYSSYTKYVLDINGTLFPILTYSEPDTNNKISLSVNGNCFSGSTGFTQSYLIRPNDGIVEGFFFELDEIESVLLDRESSPKYQGKFRVPRDLNGGDSTELMTEIAMWPISRDNWNIQIVGVDFNDYIAKLVTIGEEIDNYKSNLIVRFLTAPQLFEFDTEDRKAEAIFQIFGQSFDRIKKFIDNIAYMRNVTYDKINNVPDILLKNLSETLGLSTVNLFDEKSLQDSLYTRHTSQYDGISTGKNLVESEYEFYRRILVNLANLYKTKGTRLGLEFFLKFIGAPEPMIIIDEYVYNVDGTLPTSAFEDDIRSVIQGTKVFYSAIYDETISGYTLNTITGSTTLTRDEYPVDANTGLPKLVNSADGSLFFENGAGWYRKTLNHRSHDILDVDNSILTGNTKTIKTKSKPFTYGEDYFNSLRTLPGLDYGYDLTSSINNVKAENVTDENSSKLILNRKNVNIFVSSDRAIDYDIYTKSRNMLLSFGSLPPQTGVTFAEFLDMSMNSLITNSNLIKYKKTYNNLLDVYNEYYSSTQFTPYNYIKVNEFVERMSPYWTSILDQFVPATTQWLGGNSIENGTFNRSKHGYIQPCSPTSIVKELFPDFETIIPETLERLLGGGSVNGYDQGEVNLRGLFELSDLIFNVNLKFNDIVYTSVLDIPVSDLFTGFTPSASCTSLTETLYSMPLICDYNNWFNYNLPSIKLQWIDAVNNLVEATNANLSVEYFTSNGVEMVNFIASSDEDGNCIKNLSYYFSPEYDIQRTSCDLRVEFSTNTILLDPPAVDCQYSSDVYITIINDNPDGKGGFVAGIEENNTWPVNFYVTHNSTCFDEQCADCGPGYVPYDIDTCYKVSTTGSTAPGSFISLSGTTGNTAYTRFGTKFYSSYDSIGGGTIVTTITGNTLWQNTTPQDTTKGPLNRCGIWTDPALNGDPLNEWLGFSACLSGITASKTYYIGIAGDNEYRLVFDGTEIINTYVPADLNYGEHHDYWHVYPIVIGAGDHIIELFGLNRYLVAAFGCEIYDNTLEELTGFTGHSQLNIIFTTSGQTTADIIQTTGGTFLASGYTCPSGYSLSCDKLSCIKIEYCESVIPTGTTNPNCTNCSYDEASVVPITSGATECTFMISGVTETDLYDIIVSDAGNCEQKIRIEGLELKIIEASPGVTGYTFYPKLQYKTSFDFGIKKGTIIYKVVNPLVVLNTWQNLQTALGIGDIVEIPIENIIIGDVLLSITPIDPSLLSAIDFVNAPTNGYKFTFNYSFITVTNTECLSSIKSVVINDEYVCLPTEKVYVYTNKDETFNPVVNQFRYKYPEDLFISQTEQSDVLINKYGYPIEVTGVTFNQCDRGIFYELECTGSTVPGRVVLFNGQSGGTDVIISSYEQETFECLNLKAQHYYVNNVCTEIPTISELTRDVCGFGECGVNTKITISKNVVQSVKKGDTGALYNWWVASDPNLPPVGYHVPDEAEYSALVAQLGGIVDAGGPIKTPYGWLTLTGTNTSGFSCYGSGYRDHGYDPPPSTFKDLLLNTVLWTNEAYDSTNAWYLNVLDEYDPINLYTVDTYPWRKTMGGSIRFIRDTDAGWSPGETITDYDGNVYTTVHIGTQVWTVENLKTTHLNNGTIIPIVTGATAWDSLTNGGMSFFNNNVVDTYVFGDQAYPGDTTSFYVTVSGASTSTTASGYVTQTTPLEFNNLPLDSYTIMESPTVGHALKTVTPNPVVLTLGDQIKTATIINGANNPPVINDQSFDVYENTVSGTSVGTVVASDSEGNPITFTILSGSTASGFTINSITGELTVYNSTILNHSVNPVIYLLVKATDDSVYGDLSDTAIITINVLQVFTACATYAPHYSASTTYNVTGLIGLLSSSNIITTSGTLTDYIIEWKLGSTTGVTTFITGNPGNTDPSIQAFHPFQEPVVGGTFYPVIRSININGTNYSSYKFSSYGLYSPDLITCLGSKSVVTMNCSNGVSLGDYPHIISYVNSTQSSTLAQRTLQFDLGPTSTQIAWSFVGNDIADRVKISYVSGLTETVISDWVIGNDNPVTDYLSSPQKYKTQYTFKQVFQLSGFTYVSGNYLKFEISPSYNAPLNTDTNWTLSIKCFTSVDPFECFQPPTEINEPITGASMYMTYLTGSCVNRLSYQTVSGLTLSDTDGYKYLQFSYGGTTNWTTAQTFDFQNNTTSVALNNGYGNNVLLNGVLTIAKSGTTITYSFTDNNDYLLYKSGYTMTTGSTLWSTYSTSGTSVNHYRWFYDMQKISMTSGDTGTFFSSYRDFASTFVFDDIGHIITVDLAAQTNDFIDVPCSTTYESIASWVATANNFRSSGNFTYTTIWGLTHAFAVLNIYEQVNAVTGSAHQVFIRINKYLMETSCSPSPDWFLSGDFWYIYKTFLYITIGDINDAANHYKVYNRLLPNGTVDTGWTLIQSVG